MLYMLAFDLVMACGYRANGARWAYARKQQHWRWCQMPFAATWPGAEEAVLRGLPMLFIHNRLVLGLVLAGMNLAFLLHPDARTIGLKGCVERYLRGLAVCVPAMLGSLYGCYLVHAAWNVSTGVKYWEGGRPDRLIIWTAGPKEILFERQARPSIFPLLSTEEL